MQETTSPIFTEFPKGTLGISYQGKLLAEYTSDGKLIHRKKKVA
jgi:hypothetical protein